MAHSCSIDCYKTHQNVHAGYSGPTITRPAPVGLPPKPPPAAAGGSAHPRSGDISTILGVLDSHETSTQLQRLYLQYPKLRNQLREIYEATNKPSIYHLDDYASSTGRAYRYRGRGRGREHEHRRGLGASWSQDKGFKGGLHQMRKLRHLKGGESQGLTEFCKVVASLTENNTPDTAAN